MARPRTEEAPIAARAALAAAAALALAALAAEAQPAGPAPLHLKVLAEAAATPTGRIEQAFWREAVPAASGGRIAVDLPPADRLGLDAAGVLRMLRWGAVDIATVDLTRLAADDPRFEGCELAGLALEADAARAACNAYRPVLDRLLQRHWNARLLAIAAAPPAQLWCRAPLAGAADLKGRKIRSASRSTVDLLAALGASPVTLAAGEVPAALQRTAIDCAVGGAWAGNAAGWAEAAAHLWTQALAWPARLTAVNLDSWRRFDPGQRDFLAERLALHENAAWAALAGIAADTERCNAGGTPCRGGKPGHAALVAATAGDAAALRRAAETAVLRGFARRCGPDCTSEWNDTVGKVLGLTASAR